MMIHSDALQQAKAGNEEAIAFLLSRALQADGVDLGVEITVAIVSATLEIRLVHVKPVQISLESGEVLDPAGVLPKLVRVILKLRLTGIRSVTVQAYETADLPVWTERFSASRQSLVRSLAQYGDVEAIAHLLTHALAHWQVVTHAQLQGTHLQLTLEAPQVPDRNAAIILIQREIATWHTQSIHTIDVRGQQTGITVPTWTQALDPHETPSLSSTSSVTPKTPTTPNLSTKSSTRPFTPPRPDSHSILVPGAWTFKFDPFKLGFIIALAAYGFFCAPHYTVTGFINGTNFLMMFIHGVNLIFHEAGHTLFMIFGRFLHILGGSLLQILVPSVISGYFFCTKQHYAGAVALCWTGENFWDVSIYIKDAQLRLLPLLGGENVLHDWHFLLLDLRLLTQGQLIGGLAYTIGVIIYAIALFAGVYYAQVGEGKEVEG